MERWYSYFFFILANKSVFLIFCLFVFSTIESSALQVIYTVTIRARRASHRPSDSDSLFVFFTSASS